MKISGRIESGRMQAVYTNEIIFVPNQHKHVFFVFFLTSSLKIKNILSHLE